MRDHVILREGMEVLCKHCGGWHVLRRDPMSTDRQRAESSYLYFTHAGGTYYGGSVDVPSMHPVREPQP